MSSIKKFSAVSLRSNKGQCLELIAKSSRLTLSSVLGPGFGRGGCGVLISAAMFLGVSQATADVIDMLVPTRTLQPGETLSPRDFYVKQFHVTHEGAQNYILSHRQLHNAETARVLQAGKPVPLAFVRPVAAIRKGQKTQAILSARGLSIETTLLALEDGTPGATIAARNPTTGAKLMARVRQDGTLEVIAQ
jgi:flagella basal body P-ring formation protein FlgA